MGTVEKKEKELTAEQVLDAISNCRMDRCRGCAYLWFGEQCMDELLEDAAKMIVKLKEAKDGK